ncbi:hypothetical protein QE368_000155 [Asaia bogorensis NBRC 16594]|nr:hypothetical protein [Asaia bogorensis NBRC 16594]
MTEIISRDNAATRRRIALRRNIDTSRQGLAWRS